VYVLLMLKLMIVLQSFAWLIVRGARSPPRCWLTSSILSSKTAIVDLLAAIFARFAGVASVSSVPSQHILPLFRPRRSQLAHRRSLFRPSLFEMVRPLKHLTAAMRSGLCHLALWLRDSISCIYRTRRRSRASIERVGK